MGPTPSKRRSASARASCCCRRTPGQVKAELNSISPEQLGTAAQAELEARINDLLFVH